MKPENSSAFAMKKTVPRIALFTEVDLFLSCSTKKSINSKENI